MQAPIETARALLAARRRMIARAVRRLKNCERRGAVRPMTRAQLCQLIELADELREVE
jgi:hypothetical protein